MSVVMMFFLIPVLAMVLIPFLKVEGKALAVFTSVFLQALLTGFYAVQTLSGNTFHWELPGSLVTGPVTLSMDALSGWFMLIIDFVFLTGCVYGIYYMKAYRQKVNQLSLHAIAFLLAFTAMLCLCVIQNSLVFLIAWEIMALSAFILVIFEHEKMATLHAGINYLIQSHVSIVFLMIAFIWIAQKTGSYEFSAITAYTSGHQEASGLFLFLCFFVGFAIKAGFVPFHTWLPYAHPAAPAHISGIMSGVIIKIGIFGILRMISLIRTDYTTLGYILLFFSVISGLYGVMLAIVQHNLKKLLAYHSIENIGIIGIGIGMGCIGMGSGNSLLASLGFAGALLHTLNHALFKSLLFYTAGNVYQAAHTLHIEQLGGVIRKMPLTASLFLLASVAICGIPPLNGFVSEFLLYNGLYEWLQDTTLVSLMVIIFTILGLVMIGGLALLCFTKAFGIVFLGVERRKFPEDMKEIPLIQRLPLSLIAACILFIGLFPQGFMRVLQYPVSALTQESLVISSEIVQPLSIMAWGFVVIAGILWAFRTWMVRSRSSKTGPTWGCGYTGNVSKLQYTASSFVRTYSKLFGSVLLFFKKEEPIRNVFPDKVQYESHAYDKIESNFIDPPIKISKVFMGRFAFLQNGKLQFYILYGILFILSVLSIPLLYDQWIALTEFLKQL